MIPVIDTRKIEQAADGCPQCGANPLAYLTEANDVGRGPRVFLNLRCGKDKNHPRFEYPVPNPYQSEAIVSRMLADWNAIKRPQIGGDMKPTDYDDRISGRKDWSECVECGKPFEKSPFDGPLCNRCYRKIKPFSAYDVLFVAMIVTILMIIAFCLWRNN